MEINKKNLLNVNSRKAWRNWLAKNFETESEVWLLYPKKHTGEYKILYNDAVEEALCFGWIDSIHKTFDKDYTAQRFSPRRPKSGWSQPNKERIRLMVKLNLVHPKIKPLVEKIASEKFVLPKDILNKLKKDAEVWKNFQKFSENYKRIRIAYIDDARAVPEEFKKRLENFISKTRENKQIGFGGIEKYY